MNLYHVAVLCLLVWLGLVGELSISVMAAGAVVSVMGALVFERALGGSSPPAAVSLRAAFVTIPKFYLRFVLPGIVSGAWAVARAPWRTAKPRPCILCLELPDATDMGISLLAHGIMLAPNEQVISVDAERGHIYLHVMDAADPERRRAELLRVHDRFLRGRV